MSSTFILIDTTLISLQSKKPWMKKRRKPSWVVALYDREAMAVSPILIDIEKTVLCNATDAMMQLVNAKYPQLGISFIETTLSLLELRSHLREFIYIKTHEAAEYTLRFADCVVLPMLSSILTSEQWSSIVQPFKSWKIHDRNGALKKLPLATTKNFAKPPLLLSNEQIALLRNRTKADELLVNLRKVRPGKDSEYSSIEAFEYANNARKIWISAGHAEDSELLLFIRDVFETNGRILYEPALGEIMALHDPVLRRRSIGKIVNDYMDQVK